MQVYKDGLGVRQFSSFFTPINQKGLLSCHPFLMGHSNYELITIQ